mgnify:CR=1 FL=1
MDAGIYTDVRRAAEGDSFLSARHEKNTKSKNGLAKTRECGTGVRRHFVQRVTENSLPTMLICASIIYSPSRSD